MRLKKRLARSRVPVRPEEIPEYQIHEPEKRRQVPRWLRRMLGVVIILAVALYVPPVFEQPKKAESVQLKGDTESILVAQQYLKDHPDDDFDGDGLSNSEEARRGTDPYRLDSDGDGVTDYAEVHLTETNPNAFGSELLEYVKKQMEESNTTIRSPYKIHEIIMWPDNLESRARGAVVKTLSGYRFCSYSGWAQFPEGAYVYQIDDGIHKELKRNKEGAVYIPGPDVTTVEAYKEPLEMTYTVRICGHPFYFTNEIAGNILDFLLPSHGPALFSCIKSAKLDLDPDIQKETAAEIRRTDEKMEDTRFGGSQIQLKDLARVRKSIEDGDPVLVSLFSKQMGESIALVYGYTATGDLLIADQNKQAPIGVLSVQERASRLLDQSGDAVQYEWFTFKGLGYSSWNGDRINFFSAVVDGEAQTPSKK